MKRRWIPFAPQSLIDWNSSSELTYNIKTLLFRGSNNLHDKKQRTKLIEDLSRPDLSVTTMLFDGIRFELNIMEDIVKILSTNPRIKKLRFTACDIPDACFNRFCKGLESSQLEILELDTFLSTNGQLRALAAALKNNRTVKKFKLKNQSINSAETMKYIRNILKYSHSITSFKLWTGSDLNPHLKYLARLIRRDKLKHLTIRNNKIQLDELKKAFESCILLQSLEFRSKSTNYALLGEILQTNKSIKRLKLDGSFMTNSSIIDLKLSTNTSLEYLSVVSCSPETGTTLFSELKSNRTLKSLRFATNAAERNESLDLEALQNFLEENKTLMELNLPAVSYSNPFTSVYLSNGLKDNTTLRKLSFYLAGEAITDKIVYFIQELQYNRGLTHINLGPILGVKRVPDPIMEALIDLGHVNKTLRWIDGTENNVEIQECLAKNRHEQDFIITNTCTLIKMILMKPNSFILPIEVWSNIFKYASYSFVPFDFEEFFHYGKITLRSSVFS